MSLPYFEKKVTVSGNDTVLIVPVYEGFRAVKLLITAKSEGPAQRYSMGLQFNSNTSMVYNWTDISGRNNPSTGNGIVEARTGGSGSEVRAPLGIIPGSWSGFDANHLGFCEATVHNIGDDSPVKPGVTGFFSQSSSLSVNGIESGTFGGRGEVSKPITQLRIISDDNYAFAVGTHVAAYRML